MCTRIRNVPKIGAVTSTKLLRMQNNVWKGMAVQIRHWLPSSWALWALFDCHIALHLLISKCGCSCHGKDQSPVLWRHCNTDFSHPFPTDILGPATIICMLHRVLQWHLWLMTDRRVGIPGKRDTIFCNLRFNGISAIRSLWCFQKARSQQDRRKSTLRMNELENEKVNMIYAET